MYLFMCNCLFELFFHSLYHFNFASFLIFRECLLVCESKYRAMSIDYLSYRQALAEMRNDTSSSDFVKEMKTDKKNW